MTPELTRRRFAALLWALPLRAAQSPPDHAAIRKQLAGRRLFLLPFSHTDWAWVNSRAWMVRRHAEVLAEALDILKTNPEFRFYIETWNEQTAPFLARKPERAAELRRAIQSGAFEVCGAFSNQHPGWMEQESLVRDLVLGRRLFEQFAPGARLEVMTRNDVTPGPSQMPQILRKAGYRFYRINRPHDAMTAQGIPLAFAWKGLDGTELITSRGSTCGFYMPGVLPDDFAEDWPRSAAALYKSEIAPQLEPRPGAPVFMPVGCDDSRPLRFWQPDVREGRGLERKLPLEELIRRWNEAETSRIGFATPVDYFRTLEKSAPLPVHSGVVDPTMWTYWYGLNGNRGLRAWRTRADESLVTGESFWTCAGLAGESYPDARFQHLWRELLGVYSHAQMWLFTDDYEAQLNRAVAVLQGARELRREALNAVVRRIKADGGRSCAVLFNPLPWDRTEAVEVWAELQDRSATNIAVSDSRGNRLEHQAVDVNWYELPGGAKSIRELKVLVKARVPALGYTTLYVDPAPGTLAVPEARRGAAALETDGVTISFSGRGVESVTDRRTGAKFAGVGNVIYNRIQDTGPYHYGPVVETLGWTDAQVERVVTGPLRSSFTVGGRIGPHFARAEAWVDPAAGRIAYRTVIESAGGSGHFMAVAGLPGSGKLVSDVHFGVEDRDVGSIRYGSLERKRENVFFGAHWTDFSSGPGGLTFIGTTGEKGYQYTPDRNLLAHFLLMTNPPATAVPLPAGAESWERFVTPAREGTGRHEFDYQFLLHAGDWKKGGVVRRALEARFPILVSQLDEQLPPERRDLPQEKSFLKLTGAGVQLSAFHREGNSVLIRIYESLGASTEATLEFPLVVKSARATDFNGQPAAKQVSVAGSSVRVRLEPWEIVTLAVI